MRSAAVLRHETKWHLHCGLPLPEAATPRVGRPLRYQWSGAADRDQSMQIYVTDGEGRTTAVAAQPGRRLMEIIRNSEVPIRADCGGVCSCSTCQVYVDEEWLARLGHPDENEAALLEVAEEVKPQSRLSCQIEMGPHLDGLRVTMAPGSE